MASLLKYRLTNPFLLMLVLLLTGFPFALSALRVPAHLFPDSESDVITWVEVDPEHLNAHPHVLDSSLEETWYWSTHTDDFVGYVSKREVMGRSRLKPGTVIRVNPTYTSSVLTKYESSDRIRVRSRLSVARVSFEKEIPVYFRIPGEIFEEEIETIDDPYQEDPVFENGTIEEQPSHPVYTSTVDEVVEPSHPQEIQETTPVLDEELPPQTTASPDIALELTEEPDSVEEPPVTAIPEVSAVESIVEEIDPLLEEKPRVSNQELANMAPPPADIYQEFEGFLKVVAQEDPSASTFQYQLEARSGIRIVYIKIDQLRKSSYESYIDQWINVRGTLEETDPDFTLYIDANSIWVAPNE